MRSRSAAFASAVLVVLVLTAAAGAAPAAGLSFGAAKHYPTGRGPVAIAVGDFNGDGAQDLATANGDSHTVNVLLGDGNGGFAVKTDFATGPFPCAVAVGDFNGDGAQDLATADFGGDTVSVLLGDGSGRSEKRCRTSQSSCACVQAHSSQTMPRRRSSLESR